MAYAFTCYGNDSTIASTSIYANTIGQSYTVYYGDTLTLSGFSYSMRFTANPASGCNFTRWVYRLGSTSGTVQYSYSNPFTYSGTQDIYIRAEGEEEYVEPPSDSWELSSSTIGSISALKSISISLSSYTLYRYRVSFANSGTAKFYTEGTSADTYGFLSTSTGWDSEDGAPTSPLKEDDDTNGAPNFFISYNVTAGTNYYIWVRGYSGTTTGSTTLYIEPPGQSWTVSSGALGTISEETSASFSLSTKQLKRYSVSFENSGEATFYTSSSEDTYGYLSTSSSLDSTNGEPSSYIASDDDSSSGNNFAISYNVTAGTIYYIWVRQYSGNSTGAIDLYIEPPEAAAVRPSNFSWTYTKTKGGSFNLTAAEWNALTARINAFREYKGLSSYSFTYAYKGNDFTAAMYNQAVNAIKGISGYGSYLSTVSSGDTVTAAGLNLLRDELNAIP